MNSWKSFKKGSGTTSIRNDFSKGKMILSEESSGAAFVELIELRRTSATIQCFSCLKHVPEGLIMCQCGVWLRPNQSTMDRIRTAFAALKTLYFRASVMISRRERSGHNPWQMDHQKKKHGCKKRSTETRQIHLFAGPMTERRSFPSVSICKDKTSKEPFSRCEICKNLGYRLS